MRCGAHEQALCTPCDLYEGDEWYPASGRVKRVTYYIPYYGGEPVTGEYISTTGGLDRGAAVLTVRETPRWEQYAPGLFRLPAGRLTVSQSGAELSATLAATMLIRRCPQTGLYTDYEPITDTLGIYAWAGDVTLDYDGAADRAALSVTPGQMTAVYASDADGIGRVALDAQPIQ